jgi:hypothetical protein
MLTLLFNVGEESTELIDAKIIVLENLTDFVCSAGNTHNAAPCATNLDCATWSCDQTK